jgi:hypothetical protein
LGTDEVEEIDQVVDVVVEIEAPFAERDRLGVGPVGDPHVLVLGHARDGAAQQRRVVPAHRRDDQQLGRAPRQPGAAEMAQRAERLLVHDRFGELVVDAVDGHLADVEGRLAALLVEVREDLQRAGDDRPRAEVPHWQSGIVEQLRADRSPVAGAVEQRLVQLVGIVEHSALSRSCGPSLAERPSP